MPNQVDPTYFKDLRNCPSGLISWSHSARFKTALQLTGHGVGKLLDYGCGDGTYLELAANRYSEGVGTDTAADYVIGTGHRLAGISHLRFVGSWDLSGAEHLHAYDLVTCMETLEHCLPNVVDHILDDMERLVAPHGRIIISVPIETGPMFLVKYVARKLAGRRNIANYKYYEDYSLRDGVKMLFAGESTDVERPAYGDPGDQFYTHYGFNWRRLRQIVAKKFKLERTLYSPMNWLGPWFNSQAWFVCRPRTQ